MNALAGGGMFLVFPALVMAGLPPISANATASAVTLPGGIASAWVYGRQRGCPANAPSGKLAGVLIAASLAGALAGSVLLLKTSNARFAKLVPWLMLGAALVFSLGGPIRRFAEAHTSARSHGAFLAVGQFLIAVYGGYFGAGMGVLMIVLFLVTVNLDVQASAALRLWSATSINLLAVGIFAWRGIVEWRVGVPMLVAAVIGGYVGAHAVQKLSSTMARRAVLVYAWATGVWLLVRSW